jgi:hypothetical protein
MDHHDKPTSHRWTVIALAAFALAASCLTGRTRGYALYPATYPPPQPDETAMLAGYVEIVDGQDVSDHGSTFELLPGCHLVGTPTAWGSFTNAGGVAVKTGHLTFALPMKPARQYIVAIRTAQLTGPTGSAVVEATEKDLKGNTIQVVLPARSQTDVDACREAAAQSRPLSDASTSPVDRGVSDAGD